MTIRILRRTISEDYEINPDGVLCIIESTEGKKIIELSEDEIINLFELHDGSSFGDNLFSQVDLNVGYEISEREDDD
jgi:hypothetical protein